MDSDLQDPGASHAYIGHLGYYAGVTRTFVPAANCTAVTGHIYLDGDMLVGLANRLDGEQWMTSLVPAGVMVCRARRA
jgi:hypothetical protein